jgi:putative transport protein
MEVFTSQYFGLFVIICLGFILGSIKIKGISLDISAIIFVALIFGHFGMTMPPIIGKLGLILFIYTIGMQAGPGFFESFQQQGRKLFIIATIIVGSASLITFAAYWWTGIDMPVAIGLLTGALTSTPGLAAAIDATGSPLVSIGYGIAYPFGVIGVILFVRLYPKFIKADIRKAEKEYEAVNEAGFPQIKSKIFRVENENVDGKSISELRIRSMTKAVISRILHKGEAVVPSPEMVLFKGDLVKAVGTEDALKKIKLLIGNETEEQIPLHKSYEVQSILVTNKEVVNHALGTFNLWSNYQATVTRLRRSGIDIPPSPSIKLHMGDKLMVASSRENMKQVVRTFGNNDKKLSDTDFFPIAAGIVLGILVGEISLSYGKGMSFNLGLTGGILAVAMVLSRIGRTGPVIWSMSGAATQLLRQIGLMFFLVQVGTKAGSQLVDTYSQYGSQLFLIGGVITLMPMILAAISARFMRNMNILSLLGAITGSMTSTPGLAAVDPMTDTNAPAIAYATVYPVAMVLLIIFTQILGLF